MHLILIYFCIIQFPYRYETDWSKWRKELLDRRDAIKGKKLEEIKKKHEEKLAENRLKQAAAVTATAPPPIAYGGVSNLVAVNIQYF